MFELRFYFDGFSKPRLQHRQQYECEAGDGGRTYRWSEWMDVPTVYGEYEPKPSAGDAVGGGE